MAIKKSFTKDEILAIYEKAISGVKPATRYEETISLKDAVVSNFKNLFPFFGYGYAFEEVEDEIRVPVGLNFIFGNTFTREENAVLISVNLSKPKGYGNGEEELIEIEDLAEGDLYEIPIKKFADIFADKEFSEDNVELLKGYDFNE